MKTIILAVLCVAFAVCDTSDTRNATTQRFVCYLDVEATNRTGDGAFINLDNIDPHLCTHLIYAFASDLSVNSSFFGPTKLPYDKLIAPKIKNPQLKIMVSVKAEDLNHWDSETERKVNATVDYMKKYQFDGLDVYWNMSCGHYPAVNVFTAMRLAFDRLGLLISLAVYTEINAEIIYFTEFVDMVDFISVLAYDIWRSSQSFWEANHPSPLYTTEGVEGTTVDSLIHYWLEHETPAVKLNLGIPLYGSSWTIGANSQPEPPVLASWGPINKYTGRIGQIPYFQICSSGWKVFGKGNNSTGPYAVSAGSDSKIWVGYDDVDTVTIKSHYVSQMRGLGGAAVWDLSQDDFRNICRQGRYQLTTAISRTLGIPRAKSLASRGKQSSFLSAVVLLTVLSGLHLISIETNY